jgi:hypothetical protein
MTTFDGALYNNRFERTIHGRHVPCVRKGHAGTPARVSVPGLALRATAWPLTRVLYGLNQEMKNPEF